MSTPNPTAIDPAAVLSEELADANQRAQEAGLVGDKGRETYEQGRYAGLRAAILAYTKATSMPVKAGGAGD